MKKHLLQLSAFVLLLAFVSPLCAQSLKLKSGTLDFLKGEKSLNLEYVYDGMLVGKVPEKEFTEKHVAEANAKQPGTGDKWLANWQADRTQRFEPKFAELLNKQFAGKTELVVAKNPDTKYTLVLKTLVLEPGWNVAVMRVPAAVSTEAEFYDTKDRSKPLAVITILKAPGRDGMGYDFDAGYRMQEGYAKTGKELGSFLCKKALK